MSNRRVAGPGGGELIPQTTEAVRVPGRGGGEIPAWHFNPVDGAFEPFAFITPPPVEQPTQSGGAIDFAGLPNPPGDVSADTITVGLRSFTFGVDVPLDGDRAPLSAVEVAATLADAINLATSETRCTAVAAGTHITLTLAEGFTASDVPLATNAANVTVTPF